MNRKQLMTLQPDGVPLLESLVCSDQGMVNALSIAYPSMPRDYLDFLLKVGSGDVKDELGFAPYHVFSSPQNAAKEYFRDRLIYEHSDENQGAKGEVWLFATDSVGTGFGFDSGDDWRLVMIDSSRTVTRLKMTFTQFVEGILVCYPVLPIKFEKGAWIDAEGEEFYN